MFWFYDNDYKVERFFLFMKIAGLQKVTMIDYPEEIACTIFLYGCNFRCGFCYNPDLVVKDFKGGFNENKVLEFLEKRAGKLDGICITGGEPLMSLNLDFVRKIKKLGYKIKIDTNGSFPDKLKEMIKEGIIDYISMDVKGAKEDYKEIANVNVNIEKIEESMKLIHEFGNYEFRTTIVNRFHNIENVVRMGKWLNEICGAKPKRFFLQGFKRNEEGMIDSSFLRERNVSEEELLKLKKSVEKFFVEVRVRV